MLAKSMAHAAITVEHLLVVLTLDHEATSILAKYRRDVLAVRRTAFQLLFNMLRTLVPMSQGSLPMANDLFSTIMRASELAAQREVELRAISINDVLHVLYAENNEQQRSGFDQGQDKTFASREVANHELSLKDMTLQREFVNSLAGNSGHEDLTADSVDTARDAQQPEMRHRLEVLDAKLERSGAEQRQVSMKQAQATQQTLQELSELKRLLRRAGLNSTSWQKNRRGQHSALPTAPHARQQGVDNRPQWSSYWLQWRALSGSPRSRYGAELQTLLNKLLALVPFAGGASSPVVKGALLPTLLSGAVSSDQEDLVDCSVFGPSECSASRQS